MKTTSLFTRQPKVLLVVLLLSLLFLSTFSPEPAGETPFTTPLQSIQQALFSFSHNALTGASIGDPESEITIQATTVSSCTVLNTTSEEYVLSQNLNSTGDCIQINASHVVLDGAGFTLTGFHNGTGIFSQFNGEHSNITIRNFAKIENFSTGVKFWFADSTFFNNTIAGNTTVGIELRQNNGLIYHNNISINRNANNTGYSAILLTTGAHNQVHTNTLSAIDGDSARAVDTASNTEIFNNSFWNNNLTGTGEYTFFDRTPTSVRQNLFYNNSLGRIEWTNRSTNGFLSSMSFKSNSTVGLGYNIHIGNNTAALNASSFTNGTLGSTAAQITLRGLNLNNAQLIYVYDNFTTSSATILASGKLCTNCTFQSYSSGTVIFNITQFSSYAVADNTTPTHFTPILNTTNLLYNDTSQNVTLYPQNVSDPNNEHVKNITNWYRNATSIMVLNIPFEGNGKLNGTDFSGFNNNVTDVIGAVWNASAGVDSFGAYQFDGNDQVIIPDSSFLRLNQSLSVEVWMKANTISDGAGNVQTIIAKTDVAADSLSGWSFTYDHTDGRRTGFFLYVNGWQNSGFVNLTVNNWHHLVATWVPNGIISFYADGVLVNSSSNIGASSFTLYTGNITIGNNFDGIIDSIRIYNRSLNSTQIHALFNNRTDLIVANETQVYDVWQACVTPHDGTTNGSTLCSNNVSITDLTVPSVACGNINADITMDQNLQSNSTCFTFNTDHVTLNCAGYAITGNRSTSSAYGVWAINRNNVSIKNCLIRGYDDAISVFNTYNSSIHNSTLFNNSGSGISVGESYNTLINNNTVYNNSAYGILLFNATLNTISYNNITGNNNGAYTNTRAHSNVFLANRFDHNKNQGLGLEASYNNSIAHNSAYNNSGDGFVLLDISYNITFTNNTASRNSDGFDVTHSYNITFISNSAYNNSINGFYNSNLSSATFSHNTIFNNTADGILMVSSARNTLTNNTIYNNLGDGFSLNTAANNTFINNTVYRNNDGFYVSGSSVNNTFTNSTVHNHTNYGFSFVNSNTNVLSVNFIYANNRGINVDSSHNNSVFANIVYNNTNIQIYIFNSTYTNLSFNIISANGTTDGLSISTAAHYNTLRSNTVTYTNNGIYISQSSNNTIDRNTLASHDYGIWVTTNSHNNTISANSIYNNSLYGIELDTSSNNNTITLNLINSSQIYGLGLLSSFNNTISLNNLSNHSGSAIYSLTASANTYSQNRLENNSNGYQFLEGSVSNIVTSDIIFESAANSIDVEASSSHNTFSALTISSTRNTGRDTIYVIDSNNNSFTNITISRAESTGFSLLNTTTITISNSIIRNGTSAVRVNNSYLAQIENTVIDNFQHGLFILGSSSNNTFRNLNFTLITRMSIQDEHNTSYFNSLFYNNSFGELRWLSSTQRNLSFNGTLGLDLNLFIANNTISLNSSALTSNLNSSANLTLRGLTLSTPRTMRFENVSTNATLINLSGSACNRGSCHVINYSGGIFIFNTTSFSSFTAVENTVPTTVGVIVNTSSGSLHCYVNVSDTTDNRLFVNFSWHNNSVEVSSLRGQVLNVSLNTATLVSSVALANTSALQNWTCSARAYDGDTYASSLNATITMSNTLPNVTIPIITPTIAWPKSTLTANTTYTDADGHSGAVTFIWTINGVARYNQTNTSLTNGTVIFASLAQGNFTSNDLVNVSVYANDSNNISPTLFSSTVTIQNGTPNTITVFTNSTTLLNKSGNDLNCYVNVTDSDDTTLFVNYTWYNNSQEITLLRGQASTIAVNVTVLVTQLNSGNLTPGDVWSCSVRAYDAEEYESDWNNASNLTILNTPPNITLPVINPISTGPKSNLTVNITYTDDDAQLGTVYFLWYVNAINVYNQTNTSVSNGTGVFSILGSGNLSSSDIVNVSVYANDGSANSTTRWSEMLTIQIGTPNTTLIVLNSSSGNNITTDILSCYASINDTDDTTVFANYTWYNNSVEVISLRGQASGISVNTLTLITTLGAGNTTINQTWTCSVQAFDGLEYESDWNNATLIIINAVPTLTALQISPSEATVDSSISATTTYADGDNETGTVYFRWYVNGVNVFNQTNSSVPNGTALLSILNYSLLAVGDIINVSVHANDGSVNSSAIWSAQIIISTPTTSSSSSSSSSSGGRSCPLGSLPQSGKVGCTEVDCSNAQDDDRDRLADCADEDCRDFTACVLTEPLQNVRECRTNAECAESYTCEDGYCLSLQESAVEPQLEQPTIEPVLFEDSSPIPGKFPVSLPYGAGIIVFLIGAGILYHYHAQRKPHSVTLPSFPPVSKRKIQHWNAKHTLALGEEFETITEHLQKLHQECVHEDVACSLQQVKKQRRVHQQHQEKLKNRPSADPVVILSDKHAQERAQIQAQLAQINARLIQLEQMKFPAVRMKESLPILRGHEHITTAHTPVILPTLDLMTTPQYLKLSKELARVEKKMAQLDQQFSKQVMVSTIIPSSHGHSTEYFPTHKIDLQLTEKVAVRMRTSREFQRISKELAKIQEKLSRLRDQ